MKKIVWRQIQVRKVELAQFLTDKNFQPGKFHIVPHSWLPDEVLVIFVDKEL